MPLGVMTYVIKNIFMEYSAVFCTTRLVTVEFIKLCLKESNCAINIELSIDFRSYALIPLKHPGAIKTDMNVIMLTALNFI